MIIRKLAKDSAIYGGADFLSRAIAFITFPLIAAALTPIAFGALELIATTTALLGLIMNCGLNNSVQRYYWDASTKESDRPVIVSSGLATLFVFGLVALFIGTITLPIVLPYVEQAKLPLTWIALIAALFLMVFSQSQQYLLDVTRLHFAPWKFFAVSLLTRALGLILALIAVVHLNWGVDGLMSVQALVSLLILPVALVVVKKDLTLHIQKYWIGKLIQFGHPFIFASIAYWLFASIDRWMLATMSSVEEVGIYSVASRLASVVLFVSMAFGQAWSPVAIKIKTDHPGDYRLIYAKVLLVLLFVMCMVGGLVALFSGEVIGLLLPPEYAGSAMPLCILCIGVVLQATQHITAIGISLEKKTYLLARLAWVSAIINICLNWLLIPLYGANGAAWATTVSYLVLTSAYLYYTQQLHTLPLQWWKLITLLSLGAIIAIAALGLNQTEISANLLGTKATIVIACLIAGWLVLLKGTQIDA